MEGMFDYFEENPENSAVPIFGDQSRGWPESSLFDSYNYFKVYSDRSGNTS